jgi:O-antigen/teichoic acid export membrane protein
MTTLGILKHKVSSRLRSRFVRDGATLALGSIFCQVLALVSAPIMARVYEPDAYGLLGIFISTMGLATVPASLQYQQAIVLPARDRDALAILKGGILLGLITCGLLIILYLLPTKGWLASPKYSQLIDWIPLLIVLTLPSCFTTFASSWLARKQQFRELTISRILTNAVSISVGLAIGINTDGAPWGLLLANAAGIATGSVIVIIAMGRTGGLTFIKRPLSEVLEQLRIYKNFALFSTPTQLLCQFSRQSPILLLNAFAGQTAVGLFNMSNRLLGLPNALFAESLSEVFRQRVAKEFSETGQCHDLYKSMLIYMTIASTPFVALLSFFAPQLFAIILGEKWRPAGEYSQILSVLMAIQLVCSPLSSVMIIAQRQVEDLIIQISTIISLALSMYAAFIFVGTPKSLVVAYTTVTSTMYLYYGFRGFWLSKGSLKRQKTTLA